MHRDCAMIAQAGAGDARFYQRCGPFSLGQIALAVGGAAECDGRMLSGLAPLHSATDGDISFVKGGRYRGALEHTKAGAVIVPPELVDAVPPSCMPIVSTTPDEAWASAAAMFHPVWPCRPGIHPSACVAPDALVDDSAEIGAFACVEAGAEIGPRCRVASYAYIGGGVRLGEDCRVGVSASITHAELGARVFVFAGVRIGEQGFGFSWTKHGFVTAPQLGRVLIGDDVEIGANTTIDRGSVQDTVIGAGTRIDNLVQIGHNVRIGRNCVIVAQVGIAGSTVLDDFVQVGGQAALADHLHIGAGTKIGAQAGLIADAPAGAVLLGSPAQPRGEFFRQVAMLKRLVAQRRPGVPEPQT
jgi:UDP-3-O-[3-hydroxymyristoyl] glucosamine N-acyltransferase